MLVRSCLIRRLQPICLPQRTHAAIDSCTTPSKCRAFHQTSHMGARPGMPNHYETLGIPTSATPTEVKKYDIRHPPNLVCHPTNTHQTILQTLQIKPPRPPPQRPIQIKALRRHKRSLLNPRLPRKAPKPTTATSSPQPKHPPPLQATPAATAARTPPTAHQPAAAQPQA